ncbi:MAG: patatin-like phospholipase family protein [Desulfobacterales bacterium]|nr:patatin-like phospholipase family protein [Desulfobacterales bacterium]
MKAEKQAKKIGLALGGGAILGAAHIGVLGALEKRNIKISSISGTSIGAFIAALYAFGVSPQEIETKFWPTPWIWPSTMLPAFRPKRRTFSLPRS